MDWRQVTFSFVAMDQIVNQAAKIHYMFGGQRTFPVLYRANVGGGTRLAALWRVVTSTSQSAGRSR